MRVLIVAAYVGRSLPARHFSCGAVGAHGVT